MVAQTADQAVDKSLRYTSCSVGMCLQYTRTWLDIPAFYGDATDAWHGVDHKHPGDRSPQRGAPVLWTGGSSGHGHIALYIGNGKIRTTDAPSSGRVSTQPLEWIEQHWGLTYAGWGEDLNEVDIPYLDGSTDGITDADIDKIAARVWAKAVGPAEHQHKAGTLLRNGAANQVWTTEVGPQGEQAKAGMTLYRAAR